MPALMDGSVQNEWTLITGDDRIMGIFGLDDKGHLWSEVWNTATEADFAVFENVGFIIATRTDRYGQKVGYALNEALIIEAVESDFGCAVSYEEENVTLPDAHKVFVVHGRNSKARDELFNFLRALDLHPIEWSQAVAATGKGSPYVGEVLDAAFAQARVVIVLMTPDDEVRLHPLLHAQDEETYEIQQTLQSRPNVLFEAGMALGRADDRTILVKLGRTRPFSDIAGRHEIRLNNSAQARRQLVSRLRIAGCLVNDEGEDWLRIGNFEEAVAGFSPSEDGVRWERTGNLWWLGFDTWTVRMKVLGGASRNEMIHGIRQAHHHANELNLPQVLTDRFRMVHDQVVSSNDTDWTAKEREWLAERLLGLFNDVSVFVQRHQVNFKAGPDQ